MRMITFWFCLFIGLGAAFAEKLPSSSQGYSDRYQFFRMSPPELPEWLAEASWNDPLSTLHTDHERVVELIKNLESDERQERTAAREELIATGSLAYLPLKHSLPNASPELRTQVLDVLKKIPPISAASSTPGQITLEAFYHEIITGQSGRYRTSDPVIEGEGAPLPEQADAAVPQIFAMRNLIHPQQLIEVLDRIPGERATEARNHETLQGLGRRIEQREPSIESRRL